jgi:hypothetical protein
VIVSVLLVFEEGEAAIDLVDDPFFWQPEFVVAMRHGVL